MSLSTFEKTDRIAQRRSERRRQMDLMNEAANASLMDMHMATTSTTATSTTPTPESPSPSVGSSRRSSDSKHGGEDLPPPPLSHEQIRENARRFLDDPGASYNPGGSSSHGASGNGNGNGGEGGEGGGASASLVDRARQFLFFDNSPPGSPTASSNSARSFHRGSAADGGVVKSEPSTRSVPGLTFGTTLSVGGGGGGMPEDASTSPDRRRVFSTKLYGAGGDGGSGRNAGSRRMSMSRVSMRDSMRSLFSQVQTRLHKQQEEDDRGLKDVQMESRTVDTEGGDGGRRGFFGLSLWSNKRNGHGDADSAFSDDDPGNLAPRGAGDGGASFKSSKTKKTSASSSRHELPYDPDNEYDDDTCLERMRYACWTVKDYCRNHSGLMLALVIALIVGSVAAIVIDVYDGEQQFVRTSRPPPPPEAGDAKEVVEDLTKQSDLLGGGVEEEEEAAKAQEEEVQKEEGEGEGPLPELKDAAEAVRFGRIKERIVASGISSPDVLSSCSSSPPDPANDDAAAPPPATTTAQCRALAWIAEEDNMDLDVEDEYLISRYALAAFWYATNEGSGAAWTGDATGWLTSQGYCSWAGVRCHHRPASDGGAPEAAQYDDNDGITSVDLSDTGLRGTISPELFRALSNDLRHLDLSDNGPNLGGTISSEDIAKMTQLETLALGGNGLEGSIPTGLGELVRLRSLDLRENQLVGQIPTELGTLTDLYDLILNSNDLTGPIPSELGRMGKLRSLYVDSNRLSGPLPSSLFGLTDLVDLRLSDNDLTGEWPSDAAVLAGLSGLEVLRADSNSFAGPLPTAFGALRRLRELKLDDNRFSGPLPSEWADHLVESVVLTLGRNDLTGSIPPAWGTALTDLRVLDVSHNRLDGTIPTELGRMIELRELTLNDNGGIGGTVPAEMGNAFNLEIVHLHNNELVESLPSSLGNLHHLTSLRVQGNFLSGTVPPTVCDLAEDGGLEELTADCAGDNPSVTCMCCTECFEGKKEEDEGEGEGEGGGFGGSTTGPSPGGETAARAGAARRR